MDKAKHGLVVVYSTIRTGFIKQQGIAFANPRHFSGTPRHGVSAIALVGEWPKVEAAYKAKDIPVHKCGPEDLEHLFEGKRKTKMGRRVKDEDPRTVEIPDNWGELDWPDLRSLASRLSAEPIINKDEATAAIQHELDAREAAPKDPDGNPAGGDGEPSGGEPEDLSSLTDEELRERVKDKTGQTMPANTKRETLLAKLAD